MTAMGHIRRRTAAAGLAVALASGFLAVAGPAMAESAYVVKVAGSLTTLAPNSANPTDSASAELWAIANGDGTTTFLLDLFGLDPAAEGTTFGAHIHNGFCVDGTGSAALGHYNTRGTPSPTTEVWLDFTVLPGGWAFSQTTVPFVISSGAAHAMVIHAQPTQSGGGTPGAAGSRMACLPIEF